MAQAMPPRGSTARTGRLSVKVGDLVKCVSADGVIGLVVRIKNNAHGTPIYEVLIGSNCYPFRSAMLWKVV
jgi:hypothetical protein